MVGHRVISPCPKQLMGVKLGCSQYDQNTVGIPECSFGGSFWLFVSDCNKQK